MGKLSKVEIHQLFILELNILYLSILLLLNCTEKLSSAEVHYYSARTHQRNVYILMRLFNGNKLKVTLNHSVGFETSGNSKIFS